MSALLGQRSERIFVFLFLGVVLVLRRSSCFVFKLKTKDEEKPKIMFATPSFGVLAFHRSEN